MSLTVRFKNDSSVQLAPFGKISVTSGDKVVYQADFNNKEQQDMVLPGSARKWVVPLDKIEGFGKYKVSATLSYGIKGQTIERVTEFWVVPLPMIIGAGVALLLVIGAIVGLVLRKRYGKKSMSMGLGLKHR